MHELEFPIFHYGGILLSFSGILLSFAGILLSFGGILSFGGVLLFFVDKIVEKLGIESNAICKHKLDMVLRLQFSCEGFVELEIEEIVFEEIALGMRTARRVERRGRSQLQARKNVLEDMEREAFQE